MALLKTPNKAIIFEETGVDGRRMIAMQDAIEVDNTEYEAYFTGEKRPVAMAPNQGPQS